MTGWSRLTRLLRVNGGHQPPPAASNPLSTRHSSTQRQFHQSNEKLLFAATCTLGACGAAAWSLTSEEFRKPSSSDDTLLFRFSVILLPLFRTEKASCDMFLHEFDEEHPSGYTESERFFQCLNYHRSLLPDYTRRWESDEDAAHFPPVSWPRNIPAEDEIPSLKYDLQFCRKSPNYMANGRKCENLAFRIASFYWSQTGNLKSQREGYKMIKDLAEFGHPDGMCLYAMILREGRVPGVEARPEEAVVWWRRCVDLHRHIPATYELGIAMYTGEGTSENPEMAVKLFRQAAHLGHAGAAYMLGECNLDGVGARPDRTDALEWLVTSAELGHKRARQRVLQLLHQEWSEFLNTEQKEPETSKWVEENQEAIVNIERRHTIGRGRMPPAILERRLSKVQESRDEAEPVK